MLRVQVVSSDLYPVEKIGLGTLAVMARPRSGDWIEEEIEGIALAGIKRVVSLLEDHELRELGLEEEQALVEKNGMSFISYPIKDRGLPNSLADFSEFTQMLYSDIHSGTSTVVHCRAGIGRTGIVTVGILLHHGFEPGNAIELVSSKRGTSIPDTQSQIDWIFSNSSAIVDT